MRSPLVKYLDKNGIKDGVLRVLLSQEKPSKLAVINAIDLACQRRAEQLLALDNLREIIDGSRQVELDQSSQIENPFSLDK
jgi:hypothetical protein